LRACWRAQLFVFSLALLFAKDDTSINHSLD